MGLKQQQDLLAKLYTDDSLRERFRDEPTAVSDAFGLSIAETDDIKAIASAEIDWFAESLYWKRHREVKKLLPVSTELIGEQFGPLFREFSSEFSPKSAKKHLEDALAFADRTASEWRGDGFVRDILKFEASRLRHNAADRRLTICRLRHDVRPLFRVAGPAVQSDVPPRKCIAVWLRLHGRTQFFFL